jgi:glycosyltransferase involved in cell wall biosynthesis
MLEQITPVILTYNEAPNIGRNLEMLEWARDIVIVDSFSEDDTVAIAEGFSRTRVFQRRFDCLENQWNYALAETGVSTEWVLALDADYILTPEFVREVETLLPDPGVQGYRANFIYCIHGRRLRGSAYPPVTVLYRHRHARYMQDGHAHRVVIDGNVESLKSSILHDDRKPLSQWLRAQNSYMKLELIKLTGADQSGLGAADRLRKMRVLAPFAFFLYCLFVKRAILDGWPGIYYAFQRLLAELLLSLYLIESDILDTDPLADPRAVVERKPSEVLNTTQGK